jgi:tripartite-type tricarboxylate transporter receptor subunit TctC
MDQRVFNRRRRLVAGALAAALPAPPLLAQVYPAKPVKIFVGFSPGGAVDLIARAVGQRISGPLGQPVTVENRPGAGSNLAIRATIDSAPDGYTLLLAANGLVANMALYQPPPFDAEKELTPVSFVGRVPVVIASANNSAGNNANLGSVRALVDAARAKPGSITYATPGNGSTPHLAVELFARAAGVSLIHVPYKGGSPAITDVIGGQVNLVAVNALEVLPHVKSGRLKVLAVMSPTRAATLPDVPTISESGFPGFEASVWYGFMAPAGTPRPIVERLHAEVQKALASPEVRERMASSGGEAVPASIADFAALIRSERQRYEKLVREANIKPD